MVLKYETPLQQRELINEHTRIAQRGLQRIGVSLTLSEKLILRNYVTQILNPYFKGEEIDLNIEKEARFRFLEFQRNIPTTLLPHNEQNPTWKRLYSNIKEELPDYIAKVEFKMRNPFIE